LTGLELAALAQFAKAPLEAIEVDYTDATDNVSTTPADDT
jgi:hypothetical protein